MFIYIEPTVTTLKGVLHSKVFPGPPNYESIKKGDKSEKAWLLTLPRPITVFYDAKDGDPTSINETEGSVRRIQLVTGKDRDFKLFRRSHGKEVSCTGTLFHEHTGHHHTRILMDLTVCKTLEQ